MKNCKNVTRGYGFLEKFLARKRIRMADKLIPPEHRSGRILDIGCGSHPFFLINADFLEKYGMDKISEDKYLEKGKISIRNHDIEEEKSFPYDDESFDVATMLAVVEHIEPEKLPYVIAEIYRVLKKGGLFIFTTPASWTGGILKLMSLLRLVSPDEIKEHKTSFTAADLAYYIKTGGFDPGKLKLGFFEFSMNIWGAAQK